MPTLHKEIAHAVDRVEDRIIDQAHYRAIEEVARRYEMSHAAVRDIYDEVMTCA